MAMQTPWIAPSILSADFARLGDEVNKVLAAGADVIHFDVMDNHYVPNLTIGPMVCEALRKFGITAPLDVHLMVKPVDRIIPDFARAGATYISFHPEASEHVDRTIELIRENGCKPGLVLNPATPLNCLDHTLKKLDLVLLMSVNPGFGGQKFIPNVLDKVRAVRKLIDASGKQIRLEVDGGVKAEIFAMGTNHTHGDTAILVDGVLFSGDVAMRPQPSFANPTATISHWLESLGRLEALKPKQLVPSHGPFGDVSIIAGYRSYLTQILHRSAELKKAGKTQDETIQLITDEMSAQYPDKNRLAGAIRAAWNEG